MKYLHENGCPWDESACAAAAFCEHLECLKYLHERVPVDMRERVKQRLAVATWGVYKYLHENLSAHGTRKRVQQHMISMAVPTWSV